MADSDVQVRFGAQIEGLIAGVNDAKDAIEGITAPIGGVVDAFQGLAEAVGAAFVVDKLMEFEDKFAELSEQIERTSRITGVSSTLIQDLSVAVKMAGGDAETAGMTINILQKNIGAAISQAGPARAAFEGMGFSLEQLKNTDIVTLLFEMKQRLDEAGNSAEQNALKQEYLRAVAGRQAAQFLALNLTLEQVKKIAADTGNEMSPTMLQKGTALADSMHVLSLSFTGLANAIVSEASPALESFNTRMADALQGYTKFIQYAQAHGIHNALQIAALGAVAQSAIGSQPQGATGAWASDSFQSPPKDYGVQFGPPQPPANPLPPLDTTKGSDKDTRDQEAKEATDTQIALSKLAFAQIVQDQDALVAQFKETEAQKIEALKAAAELQVQTEQSLLDKEASGYAQDSLAFQQVQDKKKLLAAQFTLEVSKLNDQLAAAQKKQYEQELAPWKQLISDMGGAFDTMINGVLSGTQTWKQALGKSFDDLGIKFAEVMSKMIAEYAVFKATSGAGILGFGTTNPFAALGGVGAAAGGAGGAAGGAAQTANTTANTTALTALTANLTTLEAALGINTTTTATATTATAAGTVATTANTTTTASTGLMHIAAMAENTIATLANTLATDLLRFAEGIKSLLGFDVGSWSVPSTGPALIHQGEIILPPGVSQAVRAGTMQVGNVGGSAVGGGSGGGGDSYTISISAIDTQTGAQFLLNNMSTIAGGLSKAIRNNNSSLMNAVRS